MRRLRIALTALVFFLLAVMGTALFLLWPDGDVPPPAQPLARDAVAFLQERIRPESVQVDIPSLSVTLDLALSEPDLQALADIYYAQNVKGSQALQMVEGYKITFIEGGARLRANLKLLGFLPAQVVADAGMAYESGTLSITINSVRLGRVPLPPERLLALAGMSGAGGSTITTRVSLPSPFVLSELRVSGSSVRGKVVARVRSLSDLGSVVQAVSPSAYQSILGQLERAQEALGRR